MQNLTQAQIDNLTQAQIDKYNENIRRQNAAKRATNKKYYYKQEITTLKQLENVTYIVSSNGEELNEQKEMFHVKQEKFTINSTNIRHIDVINVR